MARKRNVSHDYAKQIEETKIEIQKLETELSNIKTALSEKKKKLKSLEKAQARYEIEKAKAQKEEKAKALVEKVIASGLSIDEIEKMLINKMDVKVESNDKKSTKDKKEETE